MNYLTAEKLCKSYENQSVLVDIFLSVDTPQIIGVIGKNGAGKTTLFNLIAGMTKPTSGKVSALGQNPINNVLLSNEIIIVDNKMAFEKGMSLKKIIAMHKHYNSAFDIEKATKLSSYFELNLDKKFSTMSTGMKAQFCIVVGLSSGAKILLMDEPVAGLDDLSRRKFYKLIKEDFAQNNRLIMISTHLFAELENVIDSVLIVAGKTIKFDGSVNKLKNMMIKLTGKEEKLSCFLGTRKVYDKQSVGDLASIIIQNKLTQKEMQYISQNGITMSDASVNIAADMFVEG